MPHCIDREASVYVDQSGSPQTNTERLRGGVNGCLEEKSQRKEQGDERAWREVDRGNYCGNGFSAVTQVV